MEGIRASWAALLCAALLAHTRAPAQDAPRTLTLDAARRIASERSWDVLSARADVDAAAAALVYARAVPNPTLSFQTAKIPTDGTPAATDRGNGLLDRSYDSTASATELVEIGGKRTHRIASAARAG